MVNHCCRASGLHEEARNLPKTRHHRVQLACVKVSVEIRDFLLSRDFCHSAQRVSGRQTHTIITPAYWDPKLLGLFHHAGCPIAEDDTCLPCSGTGVCSPC